MFIDNTIDISEINSDDILHLAQNTTEETAEEKQNNLELQQLHFDQLQKNLAFADKVVAKCKNNEYALVVLAARRAKLINAGQVPHIKTKHWDKLTSIALLEIANNDVNPLQLEKDMLNTAIDISVETFDKDMFDFFSTTDSYGSSAETDNLQEDILTNLSILNNLQG